MGQPLGAVRQSTVEVNSHIDEFLAELGQRNPGQDSERRNAVLSRQKLITWLEEQFSTLPNLLRDLPEDDMLEMFQISVVEGTDAALLIFLDALEEDDPDSWAFVEQVMGDRRTLMQDVRALPGHGARGRRRPPPHHSGGNQRRGKHLLPPGPTDPRFPGGAAGSGGGWGVDTGGVRPLMLYQL